MHVVNFDVGLVGASSGRLACCPNLWCMGSAAEATCGVWAPCLPTHASPPPAAHLPPCAFLRRTAPLTLCLSDEDEDLVFQEGAMMLWVEVRR